MSFGLLLIFPSCLCLPLTPLSCLFQLSACRTFLFPSPYLLSPQDLKTFLPRFKAPFDGHFCIVSPLSLVHNKELLAVPYVPVIHTSWSRSFCTHMKCWNRSSYLAACLVVFCSHTQPSQLCTQFLVGWCLCLRYFLKVTCRGLEGNSYAWGGLGWSWKRTVIFERVVPKDFEWPGSGQGVMD